jgi:GDP-D-mannose 3', 5'-epimerase
MKILVTGAGGFIGGHFIHYLIEEKGVNPYDITATDIKPLDEWFQVHKVGRNASNHDLKVLGICKNITKYQDHVYNFAASFGGMGYISKYNLDCLDNVLIDKYLLESCIDNGIQRYFFASSVCIYDTQLQDDENCKFLNEGNAFPFRGAGGYGLYKIYVEELCKYVTKELGLETRVARFHNCCGTHCSYNDERAKAPAMLTYKAMQAMLRDNDDLEIWGPNGEAVRTYFSVKDCVRGIYDIMNGNDSTPFNLGSNELVTVDELVDCIEDVIGIKFNRVYNKDKPVGVKYRHIDCSKFQHKFGWLPSIPVRDSIKDIYEWLKTK